MAIKRKQATRLVQKYLTDIRKTAQCAICCDMWEDPVKTPCQHVFCNTCISRLFQIEKTSKAQCPLCKEALLKRSLKKCEKFGTPLKLMRETVGMFKKLTRMDLIGESFCKTPKNATLPPQTPLNQSPLFTRQLVNDNVTPNATTKVSEWILQTRPESINLSDKSGSDGPSRKFFISKPDLRETPLSTLPTRRDAGGLGEDPYDFIPSQKVPSSDKVYAGKQKGKRPVKRKGRADPVSEARESTEPVQKSNKRKRKDPSVSIPSPEVCEVEPVLFLSQPRVYEQACRKSYTPKNHQQKTPKKTKAANDSALEEQFEALRSHFSEIEAHETRESSTQNVMAEASRAGHGSAAGVSENEPQPIEVIPEVTVNATAKSPEEPSNLEPAFEVIMEPPSTGLKKTRVTFALDSETQDLEQLSAAIRQKDYTQDLLQHATTSDSIPLEDLSHEQDKENNGFDSVLPPETGTTLNPVLSANPKIPLQAHREVQPDVVSLLKDGVTEDAVTRRSPTKKTTTRSPRGRSQLVSFRLVGTLRGIRLGRPHKGHTPFKLLGRLSLGQSKKSTRDAEIQTDCVTITEETHQVQKVSTTSLAVQTVQSIPDVVSVGLQTDDDLLSAQTTGSPAKDGFVEKLATCSVSVQTSVETGTLPESPPIVQMDAADGEESIRDGHSAPPEEDDIIEATQTTPMEAEPTEDKASLVDSDDFFYGTLAVEKQTEQSGDESRKSPEKMPLPAAVAGEFPVSDPSLAGSKSISSCPTQVNTDLPQAITEEDDDSQDLFSPTPEKKPRKSNTPTTVSSANRSATPLWSPKPKFVFSGLSRLQVQQVTELAKLVNADILRTFDPSATHVIVRTGEDNSAERTYKFLCGVAGRKWVVNFDWVKKCLSVGALVEEDRYEALDMDLENGPRRSRMAKSLLFQDFEFCCIGPFTDVSIPEMRELLKMSGALVTDDPARLTHCRKYCMLVVQTDEDYQHPVDDWLRKHKAVAVSREWVVDCIASYSLQPLRANLLNAVSDTVLLRLGLDHKILDSQTRID